MKKVLTKVGYMAFGCLLTLIGYHFGNIDDSNVNAQENAPIVDEVRCRKLVIVGRDGTPRITLDTKSFNRAIAPKLFGPGLDRFYDHGLIEIYNKDGIPRITLGVDMEDYGTVAVQGKESGGVAAELGVNDDGGFMVLYNKVLDRPVLRAGMSDKGEGIFLTRDKAGYHTGTVGSKGTHEFQGRVRK